MIMQFTWVYAGVYATQIGTDNPWRVELFWEYIDICLNHFNDDHSPLSYIIDVIDVDDLASQGDQTSAAIVLI